MGGIIAKQPNGLYCRFSSVIDTFTHWNMTEEDYIEMCAERAADEARKEAKETLKCWLHPFEEVKNHFYPGNNTIEEFNEMLHEMGDEEGLSEERIEYLKSLQNQE